MRPHPPGPESVGPESVGPESVGPESVGPESVGPEIVEPESVGNATVRPATRVVLAAPVALVLVVAALLTARPEPAIVAVGPLLVVLVGTASRRPALPALHTTVVPDRAVEGDELTWSVRLGPLAAAAEVEFTLQTPMAIAVPPRTATTVLVGDQPVELPITVRCRTWGVHRLVIRRLAVRSAGFVTSVESPAGASVTVLPAPQRLQKMITSVHTQPTTGAHPSTARGAGLEFADLRPWSVGDRPRAINWRATARSGDVWVNDRHPDRSADVVIVLDGTEADGTGAATLDVAVRAAASIADVVLRRRDRVGYVGLSSRVRWLTPGGGLRQWYRLAHTLVGEQPGPAHPGFGLRLLPPAILPPHALVIALSPLLDDRVVVALAELQRRGNDVAVVELDPLTGVRIPSTTQWQLARRLFALDRDRLRGRLAAANVDVVRWSADTAFAVAIADLVGARRRRPSARQAWVTGGRAGRSAAAGRAGQSAEAGRSGTAGRSGAGP